MRHSGAVGCGSPYATFHQGDTLIPPPAKSAPCPTSLCPAENSRQIFQQVSPLNVGKLLNFNALVVRKPQIVDSMYIWKSSARYRVLSCRLEIQPRLFTRRFFVAPGDAVSRQWLALLHRPRSAGIWNCAELQGLCLGSCGERNGLESDRH